MKKFSNLKSLRQLADSNLKSSKGFTLVELLVVIAVIAIVAAAGISIFSSVQKNSKDEQRLRDMKALEQGLELYRADNKSYPLEAEGLAELVAPSAPEGKIYFDDIKVDGSHNPLDPADRVYQYKCILPLVNNRCVNFAICAKKDGNKNYPDTPPICASVNCISGPAAPCDMGIASL